jgi:hypothetical protein
MKSALKVMLLSTALLASAASAGTLSCHAPEPLGRSTTIRKFNVPQTSETLVAPDFADLTGSSVAELVQPGRRGRPYELGTVSARQRTPGDTYRTRDTLTLPGEKVLAVKTVAGSLVASDAPAVVLVASTTSTGDFRLRYVRGTNWQVERVCELDGPFSQAHFAAVTTGGDPVIFLRSAATVSLYSAVDGTEIRTIDVPGEDLFVVGQLDADSALEIAAAGNPGLIIDAATGAVEVSHPAGFFWDLAIGRTASGGHWLATTAQFSDEVTIYGTEPFATLWSIRPGNRERKLASHDVNGDGADELLVAGAFWVSPMQFPEEVRAYDIGSQAVLAAEPLEPYGDPGFLSARPGRVSNLPEVAVTYAGWSFEQIIATFTHPLGAATGGEQNWPQTGPFSGIAEGDFDNDSTGEIAFAGPSWGGSAHGGPLHVISASDWSSMWDMSTHYLPEYNLFPQIYDVASIASPYGPGRLLITAGRSTYASLAAIDGTTHAVRWKLGTVNGQPLPMGFRLVRHIEVGDTNGDGGDEILAAASDDGSALYPGIRLHLFNATGTELWHSDELPEHRDINALKLMAGQHGPASLALVSTDVSTLAFELPGQTPVWQIGGSAKGIHPLQSGGYAILHGDCSVERLDANHQSLWRRTHGAVICTAIHEPVAGGPLLVAGSAVPTSQATPTSLALHWLNPENGAQIGESARLMPDFAFGNRWKIVTTPGQSSVRVTAGGSWGLMEVEIPLPPTDVIFMDTFD